MYVYEAQDSVLVVPQFTNCVGIFAGAALYVRNSEARVTGARVTGSTGSNAVYLCTSVGLPLVTCATSAWLTGMHPDHRRRAVLLCVADGRLLVRRQR